MKPQGIIERLLRDNPKLHFIPEDWAREAALEPGPVNFSVAPEVIRYIASVVKGEYLTLETGAGQTTVALAALAKHHTAIMYPQQESFELVLRYMSEVGISHEKVTFIQESSDTALGRLSFREKIDFAFIDGCHGYPFPAMDWHFVDLILKIGGIIGFDNTELRAVQNHCDFLVTNGSYKLVERVTDTSFGKDYGAAFFVKLKDEQREWTWQRYNRLPSRWEIEDRSGGRDG